MYVSFKISRCLQPELVSSLEAPGLMDFTFHGLSLSVDMRLAMQFWTGHLIRQPSSVSPTLPSPCMSTTR